jgi:hypothetical protein
MSDQLYVSRWAPFQRALKSKFNLFVLVLGLVILIDWQMGAPMMTRIINFWYDLKGIDVNSPKFTMLSVFGAYNKVNDLALVFDKFLCLFFLGVTALSYLWGLLMSGMKK